MPQTVDGYDLAYTHRGSWKANRILKGSVIDQVPVAWDRDYKPGTPPLLTVWFQDQTEASTLLAKGCPFVVALATKRPGGASSRDIKRLFYVLPAQVVPEPPESRSGLICSIIGKCVSSGKCA